MVGSWHGAVEQEQPSGLKVRGLLEPVPDARLNCQSVPQKPLNKLGAAHGRTQDDDAVSLRVTIASPDGLLRPRRTLQKVLDPLRFRPSSFFRTPTNNDERNSRCHHYFGYPETMMCATCRSKCSRCHHYFLRPQTLMSATQGYHHCFGYPEKNDVCWTPFEMFSMPSLFRMSRSMMSATKDTIITTDIRKP